MIPLTRRKIEGARPPWELVPRLAALDPALRPHALDAGAPEGWGTPPGGRGSGVSLLALDPEVELRGGAEVLAPNHDSSPRFISSIAHWSN